MALLTTAPLILPSSVLYSRTALLYSSRARRMRFSVPSRVTRRSLKPCCDCSSGYFSWTIIRRESEPLRFSWAFSKAATLAGSVRSSPDSLMLVASLRACCTFVRISPSDLAAAFTVSTMLGTRSARRSSCAW